MSWSLNARHEVGFDIWDIKSTLACWALRVDLQQTTPAFLDTGEGWSWTSWPAWLRNKCFWERKKEGSGTSFPGRSSNPCHGLCTAAGDAASWTTHPYGGMKCCSARHGQPCLRLARLSADCSMLSPRTSCFSPRRGKVLPSAHSPAPPHSLLFSWASAVCLSIEALTRQCLRFPSLGSQDVARWLWLLRCCLGRMKGSTLVWQTGTQEKIQWVCSEMAAENTGKLGRTVLSYWGKLLLLPAGSTRRSRAPGCISVQWNAYAWNTSLCPWSNLYGSRCTSLNLPDCHSKWEQPPCY